MDNRVELLAGAIEKLRSFNHTKEDLLNVKNAINRFFVPDAECKNIIYTLNTDKLPFGSIINPHIPDGDINSFFIVGEDFRIRTYDVELDSKLFDYGFSNEDIAAIILFNVYHIIREYAACSKVRECIDDFFAEEETQLIIRDSVHYKAILNLGLVDALNKVSSCLFLPNEVRNDPFLDSLDIDSFDEILDKLYQQIPGCDNEVTRLPKLSILRWALRLYCNVDTERIPALHLLEKAKSYTASSVYINRINAVINALNRIDTDTSINEAVMQVFTEARRKGGLFASLKYNGLRDIEQDLYEFQIRARNAESEQEVMYALKQINARIAILDDYIRENPDDSEIERWISVKCEYMEIRDVLAKKKLHNRAYGIFIDYNKLDQLDNPNESTFF